MEFQEKEIHVFFANKQTIIEKRSVDELQEEIEIKLKQTPSDVYLLTIKGQILHQYRLDYLQALQIIRKGIQLDNQNIDLRLDIVEIFIQFEIGTPLLCQQLLDECKQLDSQYWRYYYVQSELYTDLEQDKLQRDILIQGLEICPHNPWLKSHLAQTYSEVCSLEQQAKQLISSIDLSQGYNYELLRRIAYSERLIENDGSLKYLEKAIQLNPKSIKSICNLAQYYRIYKKDYEKSIECCKRALEYLPNYSLAIFNIGRTYQTFEKENDSIQYFLKCLPTKKYNDVLEFLALHFLNQDKEQEALYYLQKSIKLDKFDEYPHYLYSFVFWAQDFQKDEYEINLQQFLNLVYNIPQYDQGIILVSQQLIEIYQ